MEEVELDKIEDAKVVDARGSACPGPLLEAEMAIGTVPVGEETTLQYATALNR